MIEVQNLSKSYNERIAIKDVSFSVKKGEVLGFLGPNGAGKSTTMKILSGFISATAGEALVNGFNVHKNPISAKKSIGYLPETPPVYMSMYVEEYLKFAVEIHGVEKSKVAAAVKNAMEKCGIADVKGRIIGNLSKGYRQRVGLAQAIAHNPPVLILDEPTVGLDPKQIIDIRNLIKSLRGDHTVILSTHILPEVQATCERVVVINHGHIVAVDTLDGISKRMQGDARLLVSLKKSPELLLNKLRNLSGVLHVDAKNEGTEHQLAISCAKNTDLRADIAELFVAEKLGLLSLSLEKISLEDAFVRLVTKEDK